MKKWLSRKNLLIFFTIAGFLGGIFYWRFVGCSSGSCPLTSNGYTSSFFGALVGYIVGDSISGHKKIKQAGQNQNDL